MENTSPPKEILEALYPSVGALVIYWAILEQSLEFWVALIYQTPEGKNKTTRVPFSRAAKIEYLRMSFRERKSLAQFAKEGSDLLDQFETMAEIRDMLVHGAISSYDKKTELLTFHRLPINKQENMHEITPKYLSIRQILNAGRNILTLMTAALTFGHRLADTWVRE